MSVETISLSLPTHTVYAHSVRMTAASIAVVNQMSVEEVEDVKMAAEEGFILSCLSGIDACTITFEVEPSALVMKFTLGDDNIEDFEEFMYADMLLQSLCQEYTRDEKSVTVKIVKLEDVMYGD